MNILVAEAFQAVGWEGLSPMPTSTCQGRLGGGCFDLLVSLWSPHLLPFADQLMLPLWWGGGGCLTIRFPLP